MDLMVKLVDKWKAVSESSWIMWVQIAIFCLTLILAFVTGFTKGPVVLIFVGVFLIVGWLIALGISKPIAAAIAKKVDLNKYMGKYGGEDFTNVFIKTLSSFLLFLITSIFAFVSLIFMRVFRKLIKKPLEKRKENNKSTIGLRLAGGLIAPIFALPLASFSANVVGIAAKPESGVSKALNGMQKFLTFKQMSGLSQYSPGLISVATLAADYLKNGSNDDSIFGSINAYFQQFFNQDNYSFKGIPNNIAINAKGEPTGDIDVEFYFSLKKVDSAGNVEYNKIKYFTDSDPSTVQKIINNFTRTEESFKIFEMILKRIDTVIYKDGKPEIEKYIENIDNAFKPETGGHQLNFKANFSNIKVFLEPWQKIVIANDEYRQKVKWLILNIAGIANVQLPQTQEQLNESDAKGKVRYIFESMFDQFITKQK